MGFQELENTVDPFSEEKGETRNSGNTCPSSIATTPASDAHPLISDEPQQILLSEAERVRTCLYQLAEGCNGKEDIQVRSFRSAVMQHQTMMGSLNLDADHPLEEVGWLLLAVLLHHHGVADLAFRRSSKDCENHTLPTEITSLLKVVQRCKFRLFQERQKLGQSHKEVCAPVMEKCR